MSESNVEPVEVDRGWQVRTPAGDTAGGWVLTDPDDAAALAATLNSWDDIDWSLPAAELRTIVGLRTRIEQAARELPSFEPVEFPERPEGRWSGSSYDADYDEKRRAGKTKR